MPAFEKAVQMGVDGVELKTGRFRYTRLEEKTVRLVREKGVIILLQEQEKDLVREMRQGLLAWYEFAPGSRALLVGKEDSPWANWLQSAGLEVLCAGLEQTGEAAWAAEQEGSFDYLISVTELETDLCGG